MCLETSPRTSPQFDLVTMGVENAFVQLPAFNCVCVCVCVWERERERVIQQCLTLRCQGLLPTRVLCPWNFPSKHTGVGCYSFLWGSSQPRDWTQVSHIAVFTISALEVKRCFENFARSHCKDVYFPVHLWLDYR